MNKPIRIAITPLSPLHIGCGEDYEPTRYVVDQDKRLLYSFNPESVRLSKTLHSELLSAAQKGQFEDIYRFYDKHVKDFRPWAKFPFLRHHFPVAQPHIPTIGPKKHL